MLRWDHKDSQTHLAQGGGITDIRALIPGQLLALQVQKKKKKNKKLG